MIKRLLSVLLCTIAIFSASAQSAYGTANLNAAPQSTTLHHASITFRNQSDYTMTLRILRAVGGYYSTVTLRPYSSTSVSFYTSGSFKLKIKAVSSTGNVSYHDGGKFSVTCTSSEWTQGEMSFKMSSYGSGLGPSISAKQFESDY